MQCLKGHLGHVKSSVTGPSNMMTVRCSFLSLLRVKSSMLVVPFLQAKRGPQSVLVSTPSPPGSESNPAWSKPVLDSFPLPGIGLEVSM